MTPEELLKPRYKVIADYPAQHYSIGDVIDTDNPQLCSVCEDEFWLFNLDKYPAIFKPLQWWEERKESDMPQYVKAVRTFRGSQGGFYENMEVHKVLKWDVNLPYPTDKEWIRIDYTIPATEQEYIKNKS